MGAGLAGGRRRVRSREKKRGVRVQVLEEGSPSFILRARMLEEG